MKKFLIAAGAASLLIAAQAVASDVAGLTGSTSRVHDRLGSSVPSYNASLSLSTTQQTGKCAITEGKSFLGGEESVTDYYEGLTQEECEQRRARTEANTNPFTVTGVTAVFTATVVVAAVTTQDAAQTD